MVYVNGASGCTTGRGMFLASAAMDAVKADPTAPAVELFDRAVELVYERDSFLRDCELNEFEAYVAVALDRYAE